MSYKLKIKAKHLAAESRIIRFEEQKTGREISKLDYKERTSDDARYRRYRAAQGFKLNSLHSHRVNVVRPAARQTHLARAFLKGMPYKVVEGKLRDTTRVLATENWISRMVNPIAAMATKYGKTNVTPEDIRDWILKS